jgi:hypothetical protein
MRFSGTACLSLLAPAGRKTRPGIPEIFCAGYCNIAWSGPGGNVSKDRHRIKPDSDGNVLILVKR